jgi:hypothetical protein
MSGRIIAPEDVRRAVPVEVADADHLVIDAGAAQTSNSWL